MKTWDERTRDLSSIRQGYSVLGHLRLSLDALEAKYGMTSAVAMNRIKQGSFKHPGWVSLMTDWLALVNEPGSWPGFMPAPDPRENPLDSAGGREGGTQTESRPPHVPVDSADARERSEA